MEDTFGNVNPATTLGTFTVVVSSTSPGTMAVGSSGDLISSGLVGGPFTPGSTVYIVSNPGGSAINWTAAKTANWLDLSATGGSLAPGASTTVTVSLNAVASALAAATYNDAVRFTNLTNGSGDAVRSVSLTTISPGSLLVETTGDLISAGLVGGPFSPGSTVYTLSNPGGTSINWTAANTANWLDLSATSGSLAPGASTTVAVSLNADANALVASNYNDTVSFGFSISGSATMGGSLSAAARTPVTRAVILKVLENIKVIGQQRSEAGVFEIVIQGTPNMQITLEGTTDFIKWTGITSGQIGEDGTLTLRDPESATFATRFYRAFMSSP